MPWYGWQFRYFPLDSKRVVLISLFPHIAAFMRAIRYLRARRNLLNWVKLMLPVQSPLQKYFRSLLTQITCISLAIPAHTEGRFAIVTDVGQGMRWTRHVKRRMTLRADGEVVWS
jgi:hypothetical protein